MKRACFCVLSLILVSPSLVQAGPAPQWKIKQQGNTFVLQAGDLRRSICVVGVHICTTSLQVQSHEILSEPCPELAFTVARANPRKEPGRVAERDDSQAIESTATFRSTDALAVNESLATFESGVRWVEPLALDSTNTTAWVRSPIKRSYRG